MTNERACANSEELFEHIQDCQDVATDLASLIESAAVLDSEGVHPGGITTLLKVSIERANELSRRLDSVNLPRV